MTYEARLGDTVLRSAYAVYLDIEGDPLSVWTGPGEYSPTGAADTAINGKTFVSVGSCPILEVTAVSVGSSGTTPMTLTVGAADLNVDGAKQFLRDRRAYQGRKAWVWHVLLDENWQNPFPKRHYTGVMSHGVFKDGPEAKISLTIDRDQRLTRTPPRRLTRHSEIHPTDPYATYIVDTANSIEQPAPTVPPRFRPGFLTGFSSF